MRDKRFTRITAALFLCIILHAGLVAGGSQQWTGDVQIMSYISSGTADLDLTSLNERMSSSGLGAFSSHPLLIEFGTNLLVQHLVLESGVGGLFWKTSGNENLEASLMGGLGRINLGVNFTMPGCSWKFFPFFTVGAGVFRYSSHPGQLEFSGNAEELTSEVYWLPTFVTGFGTTLLHTFHIESKQKLFTVGVRGGVLIDPTRQSTWYRHGVSFRNGPSPLFSGPYLQLILGKGRYIGG